MQLDNATVLITGANGLAVAFFLSAHPCVDRVWYCGLEDSPFRAEAQKLLAGSAAVVAWMSSTLSIRTMIPRPSMPSEMIIPSKCHWTKRSWSPEEGSPAWERRQK